MQRDLAQIVIIFESEAACQTRLLAEGFSPEIAREVAVYLSQATDLVAYTDRLRAEFAPLGIAVDFFEVGERQQYLPLLEGAPAQSLVWNQTDGFRYYRGSFVSGLAGLLGVKTFGSGPQAQLLCQDKYKSTLLMQGMGGRTPASTLARNGRLLGPPLEPEPGGALFVKPNTLGSKLGILPESKCKSLADALELSRWIWWRYNDSAIIQAFIPGRDVRVSFMAAAPADQPPTLGIYRLGGVSQGETGGEFMTMRDNWTLSAARGPADENIGSPFERPPEFAPASVNLANEPDQVGLLTEITAQVERVAQLLGLRHYYSFDVRVSDAHLPYLLEFEVCPAVTIYDFQTYLAETYGLDLPGALRRAMPRAFAEPA